MFNSDNFTEFNYDVNSDSDFVPQTGQDLHEQLMHKCEIAYVTDSVKVDDFLADYPDSRDDDDGKYNELSKWAKNYQERETKGGRMRRAVPPQPPLCSPPITNRGGSTHFLWSFCFFGDIFFVGHFGRGVGGSEAGIGENLRW